jgi:hypothetical protein
VARSKSRQKKPKAAAVTTFVSSEHPSCAGGAAVSTATAGNKSRHQKPKAAASSSDDALLDELTSQLQSSKDFSKVQGHARANPRGAAPLASTYEGLHDNCQDAAAGRLVHSLLYAH